MIWFVTSYCANADVKSLVEVVIESIVETRSNVVAGNNITILLHIIIFLFFLYSIFINIFIVILLVASHLKLIDNYFDLK
jgi:hypothetical protein